MRNIVKSSKVIWLACTLIAGPKCVFGTYLYEGRFVKADESGHVTITQPRYPKLETEHCFRLRPKKIGKVQIDESSGMPFHYVVFPQPDGEFDLKELDAAMAKLGSTQCDADSSESDVDESTVDSTKAYFIPTVEQAHQKPYSSCGLLRMFFAIPPVLEQATATAATAATATATAAAAEDTASVALQRISAYSRFSGTAFAVDRNMLLTVAHNLAPKEVKGHKGLQAVEISYKHMAALVPAMSERTLAGTEKMLAHCFIHPKWTESLDPKYDIAVLFLDRNLELTPEQVTDLARLRVTDTVGETLRVVGHPKGRVPMHESTGAFRSDLQSAEIIYHMANTERGSSGSPILTNDGNFIVGAHRAGTEGGPNNGVRMRVELLKFLDHSIAIHQAYLERADAEELAIARKRDREAEAAKQALRDEGLAAGIEKGKAEIARKLKAKGMSIADIAEFTELTEEQIAAL